MKRARRLTLKEKRLLTKEGYNAKFFLRINKTAECYKFIEVASGKILTIGR